MKNKIEEMPIEVKALENFLLYIKFQNGELPLQFSFLNHISNPSNKTTRNKMTKKYT